MRVDIAFDLDGVLVDFWTRALAVAESMGITVVRTNRYEQEMFFEREGRMATRDDRSELYRRTFDLLDINDIEPGARIFVNRLYSLTEKPLYVVTARPIWAAWNTFRIMRDICGKTPFVVAFAKTGTEKAKYLNGVNTFVEDRRRTAYELAVLGYKVYLVDKYYNRQVISTPKIQRIESVNLLNDILQKSPSELFGK